MTKLTLSRAAKEAQIAKSTLSEAINSGRLSASKNDKGHYSIDPAELFRVFPKTVQNEPLEPKPNPLENHSEPSALAVEIRMLREQITQMESFHDRERRNLSDQIENARSQLNEANEQNKRLTALLPAPKKGLWARLTSK